MAQAKKRTRPPQARDKNRTAFEIEIAKIKRQAVREASEVAFVLMLGIPVMVLGDKHGWSKEQIQDFSKEAHKLYTAFEEGRITLEDIHKTLLEDYELEVVQLN